MLRSVNVQNGLFVKFSGDVNSRYFVVHPLLEISIQSAFNQSLSKEVDLPARARQMACVECMHKSTFMAIFLPSLS